MWPSKSGGTAELTPPTSPGKDKDKTLARTSSNDSIYSTGSAVLQKATSNQKILGVYHTGPSSLDFKILNDKQLSSSVGASSSSSSGSSAIYFVDNSMFTWGTPDVSIHSGTTGKNGPRVAAARFAMFKSDFDVCLGDPMQTNTNNEGALKYEKVKKTSSIKHSKYEWSMIIGGDRRVFTWNRFHGEGTDTRLSMSNMKLLDASGEVVAVYLSNGYKSLKKKGKIQMQLGLGEEWELMVVVTIMALLEKQRRRRAARYGGAGGGGGGGGD